MNSITIQGMRLFGIGPAILTNLRSLLLLEYLSHVVVPILIGLAAVLISWFCLRRMFGDLSRYRRWRRVAERIVLSLVTLVAIVIGSSTVFNAIATHRYRVANPPPGNVYQVDGYRMHIYCTGIGSPTLILDSGSGEDWLTWSKVQPELSETTRVCSYDRAGYGWSDPRPGPRDANQIADELHQLLIQAGITGPIVLMGHSIAGLYIRAYSERYPKNISGLIFVDAATPLGDDYPAMKAASSLSGVQVFLFKAAFITGIARMAGLCSHPIEGLDAKTNRMMGEDLCSLSVGDIIGEADNFHRSCEETIHSGPFGGLPILIFSRDTEHAQDHQPPTQSEKELAFEWDRMQENLKSLSTRSRRIIAKRSSHLVQIDRADLINKEVPIFIRQIRDNRAQATDYGSTKSE
jgi:pimeloyl-ACP methyl ester carboxylesterase